MHRFKKWRDALQIAPDAGAVMGVMQNYVDTLPAEVVEVLPPECREAFGAAPLDVPVIAVCLLRGELLSDGSPDEWQVLHDVAHIFALASTRLTLVHRQPLLAP